MFHLCLCLIQGQTPVGSWSDHLRYNTAVNVAVGSKEVYASTGTSLVAFNRAFSELRKVSRINGLTETGISSIGWSEEDNALIIAYNTTNVDLMINNIIYNIPEISNKYIPGKKTINRIRTNTNLAYLACSFGIVVIDIKNKEISDTWKPGPDSEINEVWDIAFGNGNIYTATDKGVYSAPATSEGLAYFGNWELLTSIPGSAIRSNALVWSGGRLFVNIPGPTGDNLYAYDNSVTLFSFVPGVHNNSIDNSEKGFTITSPHLIRYFNNDGSLNRTISDYGWGLPSFSQAIADNGDIWIADLNSGLVQGKNMSDFLTLTFPGPASNNARHISSLNGKTIICAGGADYSWNSMLRPLEASIHEDGKWTLISSATIKNAIRAIIDPDNNNHIFVSTWGNGLLEYLDNNLVGHFTDLNSPLQASITGNTYVSGLAIDESKNLWMTQTEPSGIKALKPDGSWIVNPASIDSPVTGDIIITKTGYKWVILPERQGIFILDDNNSPENFRDDRSIKKLITDNDNQIVNVVNTLTEDLDGNLWIGSDQGPLVYYKPGRILDEEMTAFRVKIPRNDGSDLSDYLLRTEGITSIAIDGANRKWIGTSGSGVYHVSADGTTLLKNFNKENSPILSDSILTIAIDNKSGDVWFGTTEGVQSFRGDASEGSNSFTRVYAFPNPVRENYTGDVTIAGLIKDSQIRITDISGNLVFETVSNGGMATWDLKTYNGKRVATGVYLVFCASDDGSQSCVTKMLIIK